MCPLFHANDLHSGGINTILHEAMNEEVSARPNSTQSTGEIPQFIESVMKLRLGCVIELEWNFERIISYYEQTSQLAVLQKVSYSLGESLDDVVEKGECRSRVFDYPKKQSDLQ